MTLTLLNLYNSAASQEWSMYDNDAISDAEFEDSLVVAINKSILQILSSYNFPFRERTHVILTIPRLDSYEMPAGIVKNDSEGSHLIRYNNKLLKYEKDFGKVSDNHSGIPTSCRIVNNYLVLHPVPAEKGVVTVEYYTLVIGENSEGQEIYSLKNENDVLYVPPHLEELMKEAIITRTMLNSIASESDENYSSYKNQADKALKLLIKYSKGVEPSRKIKI